MPRPSRPGFSDPRPPPQPSIIRVITTPPHDVSPLDALASWPAQRPLAAVWSTGRNGWAILASPSTWQTASTPDDARSLLREIAGTTTTQPPTDTPFRSGWIGALAYDLGCTLEPAATHPHAPPPDRDHPLAAFARCEGAYCYYPTARRWHAVGDTSALPTPEELTEQPAPFTTTLPDGAANRNRYLASVRRAIEYIHAGDIYQANLTHRLTAPFQGSARSLFARLAASDPVHGVYLEFDRAGTRTAVCSASPELFLSHDPVTARLTARPMKGTRPITASPDELRHAPKDRAELAMIVDLMRNDLGRVAEFGSMRVDAPRTIEHHADSVLQATATISATRRAGLTLADAITGAFPAGSVTGAPKIRAMQIIDELEHHPRGFYCGSAGFIDDSGHAMLNVAIRTATITGTPDARGHDAFDNATLDYAVGAGIVADSDPEAEWEESLIKAEVLRRAITPRTGAPREHPAPSTA